MHLGRGHHRKGRLLSERLGHTHRNGRLARPWLSRQQHRPASNPAVPDHLQDHSRGLQEKQKAREWCIEEGGEEGR